MNVKHSEGRGRCAVAAQSFSRGECVLVERPLLIVREPETCEEVEEPWLCDQCGKCLEQSCEPSLRRCLERQGCDDGLELFDRAQPFLRSADERLMAGGILPVFEPSFCPLGCEAVRFCSERCATEAFSLWHRAVCPQSMAGPGSDNQAEREYKLLTTTRYVLGDVDFSASFALLLRILASRACRHLPPLSTDLLTDLEDSCAVDDRTKDPFRDFCSADWEVVCARFGEDSYNGGPAEWRQRRSALLDKFIGVIRSTTCFSTVFEGQLHDRKELSRILGLIVQNSAARTAYGNAQAFVDTVMGEGLVLARELLELAEHLEESVVSRDTSCIALFSLHSSLNHSCHPNCIVMNPRPADGKTSVLDGSAVVVAVEDIEADSELTISYIFEDEMTVAERNHELFGHYNFKCDCERCVRESGRNSP